jgi:hypothetical protein
VPHFQAYEQLLNNNKALQAVGHQRSKHMSKLGSHKQAWPLSSVPPLNIKKKDQSSTGRHGICIIRDTCEPQSQDYCVWMIFNICGIKISVRFGRMSWIHPYLDEFTMSTQNLLQMIVKSPQDISFSNKDMEIFCRPS